MSTTMRKRVSKSLPNDKPIFAWTHCRARSRAIPREPRWNAPRAQVRAEFSWGGWGRLGCLHRAEGDGSKVDAGPLRLELPAEEILPPLGHLNHLFQAGGERLVDLLFPRGDVCVVFDRLGRLAESLEYQYHLVPDRELPLRGGVERGRVQVNVERFQGFALLVELVGDGVASAALPIGEGLGGVIRAAALFQIGRASCRE